MLSRQTDFPAHVRGEYATSRRSTVPMRDNREEKCVQIAVADGIERRWSEL
jgi:hypothetical protein